jgi:hypothetical protein
MVRQNLIIAFEKTAERPGLPPCGASEIMPLSNQINSDPRFSRKAVWLDQLIVRHRADIGLLKRSV